jgi:hypothetical protein
MKRFVSLSLAATAIAAPIAAHDFAVGRLKISHPWTRETAPGQVVGGGFMAITNTGRAADTLLGAASSSAKEVQLHTMSMDGGVMRMRPVQGGIPIPAGQTVTLKPGSLHIMFIGLKTPFKRGQLVPVTLRFQKTGPVKVQFKVEPVGTTQPMESSHHAGH